MANLTPYILDILFGIVLLIIVIKCAKNGFFKTLIRLARVILAAVAAYLFGSRVATFLADKFLSAKIYSGVHGKIEGLYQKASDSFNADTIFNAFPKFLLPQSIQDQIANSGDTGEALVESASQTLAGALTKIVSLAIGYVLVFVVALILLSIVAAIIGAIIKRLNILGTLDHVLGALVGVLEAWILLTLVSSVLKFFFAEAAFYTQSHAVKFLAETPITKFLSFLNLDGLLSKAFNK